MANKKGVLSKANIPKLDETNFLHWSMRMKAHLRHQGLIKKKHTETVDILMNYMSETALP
ncbi:uncharacterized protein VP01_2583g2 [Puccinia sorghi]|uniref:Uncharacterized protein n=1 Tax=Puccinia sorghi TaxID=27349 RepID=A0A0L6V5F8_9BASI|nr:uncharacterized protein VP01_2583g2 [Puccinia sorghi]